MKINPIYILIVLIQLVSIKILKAQKWEELGPTSFPIERSSDRGLGRVQFLVADPQNSKRLFTGSPVGGLFYSDDDGETWKSTTDSGLNSLPPDAPKIGVSTCSINPKNGNIWFISTGDGDAFWSTSTGIYRGEYKNGKIIWVNIATSFFLNFNRNPDFQIKKLLADPNDANVLYAATSGGLWKTKNCLDSIVYWGEKPIKEGYFFDVEFKPGDKTSCNPCSTLYASGVDIFTSQDFGETWDSGSGISTDTVGVAKIALEVTPANKNIIYAVLTYPKEGYNHYPKLPKLYYFDGNKWKYKGGFNYTSFYGSTSHWGVYMSHAQAFAVSPIDPNFLVFGDYYMVKCEDASKDTLEWIPIGRKNVHPDIHGFLFDSTGRTIWVATDGGVYKSSDSGNSWQEKSNGLAVMTMEQIAVAKNNPDLVLTGGWDIGSNLLDDGQWYHVLGSDGYGQVIDFENNNIMYSAISANKGPYMVSDDKAKSYSRSINVNYTLVMNSFNSKVLYGGGKFVARFSNGKVVNISGSNLDSSKNIPKNYDLIFKMAAAPSDSNVLYAYGIKRDHGTLEVKDWSVYITRNCNSSPEWVEWQRINCPYKGPYWINELIVDPNNSSVLYVVFPFSLYLFDGKKWVEIKKSFPYNPGRFWSLEKMAGKGQRVFLGTDRGLFYSDKKNKNHWKSFNKNFDKSEGLPYIQIRDLEINHKTAQLFAGTYGRGLWKTSLKKNKNKVRE